VKKQLENKFERYIAQIVYGAGDGIVTTLAVISGFAGSGQNNPSIPVSAVILFGLANLFADASSMGLSSFLSQRSQEARIISQLSQQKDKIINFPHQAKQTTLKHLIQEGFDLEDSQTLTAIFFRNPNFLKNYLLQKETGLCSENSKNPLLNSLYTFFAFIIFGSFPLLPYIFQIQTNSFQISLFLSLISLILLGILRQKATNEKGLKPFLEIVIISAISASIAFFVGIFFKA
jgi:VIT1/CCC1 family predicted Fe2+/Mn2+ transporter